MKVYSQLAKDCLDGCTDAQREAIQHTTGPLLVLAGPGSGKTRVIARRVAYLVATGSRPDEILAITFTNKAAGEMRDRIETLQHGSGQTLRAAGGAWISTFHSFCARVLRIHGRHVGLKPSFTIYDTSDSVAATKRAMEQLDIDQSMFQASYAAKAISAAKNRLWSPAQARQSQAKDAATIAKVYEKYDQLLRAANAADFDDLLLLMVRLLRELPDVAQSLSNRFRHVLIDEYQDTNRAQYVIAKHLAATHRNICATGDPDQCIYGWRGADLNNILEFETDYPDAKVVRLERNYRSTKTILRAADRLISFNLARKPKTLWTANPEGTTLALFRCEDETSEAQAVAADIDEQVRSGHVAPREIAVFYRINAQSRVLEAALRSQGVPYVIVAGTEFYQRKEIKDLLAYLRLVVNPPDDVSAGRAANTPPRRIGSTSVTRLKKWAAPRGLCLLEAMSRAKEAGVKGPAIKGIEDFLETLTALRAMPRRPAAALVEKLIELTEYERYLRRATSSPEERMENVRELVNAAAEYDGSEEEGDLQGFLEQAALISDVDRWDEERGGVTLMTLHSAKGLEFSTVYIVGLEERLLPLMRNESAHDIEEERRLFFVGLTRAKHRAVLTFAESRARYGSRDYTEASRFLEELPEEVMAGGGQGAGVVATASFKSFMRRRRLRAAGAVPLRRVRRSDTEEIVYDGDMPADETAEWGKGKGDGRVRRGRRAGASLNAVAAGDQVEHPTYGRGAVLEVSGYGDLAVALVRFHTVGIKRLVLKYARLRKTSRGRGE